MFYVMYCRFGGVLVQLLVAFKCVKMKRRKKIWNKNIGYGCWDVGISKYLLVEFIEAALYFCT